MDPSNVAMIYAYTAGGVGIILGLAGLGSAIGWGLITSRFLEGIARQPELQARLTGMMLFVGGLMEAFPFIVLGIAMWFTFANPFVAGAAKVVGAG